jgi:hypothetical protein
MAVSTMWLKTAQFQKVESSQRCGTDHKNHAFGTGQRNSSLIVRLRRRDTCLVYVQSGVGIPQSQGEQDEIQARPKGGMLGIGRFARVGQDNTT